VMKRYALHCTLGKKRNTQRLQALIFVMGKKGKGTRARYQRLIFEADIPAYNP